MNWNCFICGPEYGLNGKDSPNGPMNVFVDGDMRFICPGCSDLLRQVITNMRDDMNFQEIEKWSFAIDKADEDLRDHIPVEIPELAVGEIWQDPEDRLWRKLRIAYGKVGGRWCYKHLIGDDPYSVVVDSIFNGWSPHFLGMLLVPYDGVVPDGIVLQKGAPPRGEAS